MPLLCVQWKTADDVQRNCPKHAEFYSKNKFEKLVHPVGFIIRIYHDARSPERQISKTRYSAVLIQYVSYIYNLFVVLRFTLMRCTLTCFLVR